MQQPEIHTISKVPPPSYAEAMGYPSAPKEDHHVSPIGQSHGHHSQASTYPSSMPMPMPVPMPMPMPSYQNENSFYHGNPSQSSYNNPYPTEIPYHAPPGTIVTGTNPCVVHNEVITVPHPRLRNRCCNKKVTVGLICLVLIIYGIKVIVSRSA